MLPKITSETICILLSMSQQEEKYLDATSDKQFYLFQVFLFRCLSTLAVWLGPEIV